MKKLMNSPEDAVSEALQGMAYCNPDLEYFPKEEILARKREPTAARVGVIAAGGGGHEPSNAGCVGPGLLDAAVVGSVFAFPEAASILRGIRQADYGQGVLLVLQNYSGTVMNARVAMEEAQRAGIPVEMVVVGDDTAVPASAAGRRGVAGSILVQKIACAAAAAGYPLAAVRDVTEKAAANLRTAGVVLTSCTLPGAGQPVFELGPGEMETGTGICGEPGTGRQPLRPAQEIAAQMLEQIFQDRDYTGQEVAVLVNGLGGTPPIELYIMNCELQQQLEERGVRVYRTVVGSLVTALDTAGCSFTLMEVDEELKPLLDAPCRSLALRN